MNATFLSKYLDARFSGELTKSKSDYRGMVITISRDTGCDGMPIVEDIIKRLNTNLAGDDKKHPWQFVSKEIFEQSARELNISLDIFDKLEDRKDKNFVEDIIHSFSTEQYPNDFKIKKTYKEVIESVERAGGVVILGRAGVAIVEHNRRNLHIKITAPMEWRIKKMAKEYGVTEANARKHIIQSDKQRDDFKSYYMGREVRYDDYDVVLNESTLTLNELGAAIVALINNKRSLRK